MAQLGVTGSSCPESLQCNALGASLWGRALRGADLCPVQLPEPLAKAAGEGDRDILPGQGLALAEVGGPEIDPLAVMLPAH